MQEVVTKSVCSGTWGAHDPFSRAAPASVDPPPSRTSGARRRSSPDGRCCSKCDARVETFAGVNHRRRWRKWGACDFPSSPRDPPPSMVPSLPLISWPAKACRHRTGHRDWDTRAPRKLKPLILLLARVTKGCDDERVRDSGYGGIDDVEKE
ncbi:hypothetical protein DEO72_LG4g2646 [Vigna unguiculata]|uniref:Uncharacterized protein n=1 Tax=Vigna unguiculata TaxID=3917 RepID=A0A4D6LRQ0_VIGUN|nr:hypothetical protein DEO72_LG4g2646 [Vigna unguiculata]